MAIASGVGFLATSAFTATNTVPATNLSSNTRTIGANDLKPAGCSSLTLSSIITGGGNFNNTTANALVLGSSGNDTIGDNTGSACIIGGDGKDHVNGHNGDFCLANAVNGSQYKNCTTF